MTLYLQIIFTILSALCLAAILPLGTFLGLPWAIVDALVAGVFFVLMLLCKQSRDKKAQKQEDAQAPDGQPSDKEEKE